MSEVNKMIREVNRLSKITDPDKLEQYANKTQNEKLREFAVVRARTIRADSEDTDNSEKCPKCGAPLVNIEYYSAFKGKGIVTKTETDWARMKKTATTSTPYSNFHLHTTVCCPACTGRKVLRIHRTGIAMMITGVLGAILGLFVLAGRMANTPRYLIVGVCAVLIFIGFQYTSSMAPYLPTGEGTITNKRLAASEELHDFISERYVRMTPFESIERADGTNVVVGRDFVRKKP